MALILFLEASPLLEVALVADTLQAVYLVVPAAAAAAGLLLAAPAQQIRATLEEVARVPLIMALVVVVALDQLVLMEQLPQVGTGGVGFHRTSTAPPQLALVVVAAVFSPILEPPVPEVLAAAEMQALHSQVTVLRQPQTPDQVVVAPRITPPMMLFLAVMVEAVLSSFVMWAPNAELAVQ